MLHRNVTNSDERQELANEHAEIGSGMLRVLAPALDMLRSEQPEIRQIHVSQGGGIYLGDRFQRCAQGVRDLESKVERRHMSALRSLALADRSVDYWRLERAAHGGWVFAGGREVIR